MDSTTQDPSQPPRVAPPRAEKLSFLYRLRIGLFLLLGLVILALTLVMAAFILICAVLLLMTGKGLVLLVKLSKVIWLALLPAWAVLKTAFRTLTFREPPVEGQRLSREDAPSLFAALDTMRKELGGPAVSSVVLTRDLNAYAMTRPRSGYWIVPLRERHIGLGVPLLQSLSADEMLAVVAHEYGHLSGHPSRFDAFVYRVRWHLRQLLEQIDAWRDWPSRKFAGLLRWYIGKFDRISFALCRDSEYAADRAAAAFAGKDVMAAALTRLNVASGYVRGAAFWAPIYAQTAVEAAPSVRPWSQLPALVRPRHDSNVSADLLRDALDEETGNLDTHPALSDRLRALGVDPEVFRSHKIEIRPVAEKSAAETWFGERLPRLLEPFDIAWQNDVREEWRKRHDEARAREDKKVKLEAARQTAAQTSGKLDRHSAWELLKLRLEGDECTDPDAELHAFVQAHPGHAPSRLAWGRANLDSAGLKAEAALREAALLDPACAHEAALALAHYFHAQDNDAARAKAMRYWLMASRYDTRTTA